MPKKKQKEIPGPPPTEEFYNEQLRVINMKLSKARTDTVKLTETNNFLQNKLMDIKNYRAGVKTYFETKIQNIDEEMLRIDEEKTLLLKSRMPEKKECAEYVRTVEIQFKKTCNTLKNQVAILSAKLATLETFRPLRDKFMGALEKQENDCKENERKRNEDIARMMLQNLVNKENFIGEFQKRLQQLLDTYDKTYEVCVAAYTKKLIRENIKLTTTVDKMVVKRMQTEEQHEIVFRKYQNLLDKNDLDDCNTKRLHLTCKNQIYIIDKLTGEIDAIKINHFNLLKFKELYEKRYETEINCQIALDMYTIRQKRFENSAKLADECVDKIGKYVEKDERRISHLRNMVRQLKYVVQAAIEDEKQILKERKISLRERHTRTIELFKAMDNMLDINNLIEQPERPVEQIATEPALKQKSEAEISTLFKKVIPIEVPEETIAKNIPIERIIDPRIELVDAITGTTYVYTSSEETVPVEDEGMEAEDFGASSSESAQGMPEEASTEVISTADILTVKTKLRTTIGTDFVEYEEESDAWEEVYGEDEEIEEDEDL